MDVKDGTLTLGNWHRIVMNAIKEKGFVFHKFDNGKPIFNRGEESILICQGCGWLKYNDKMIRIPAMKMFLENLK